MLDPSVPLLLMLLGVFGLAMGLAGWRGRLTEFTRLPVLRFVPLLLVPGGVAMVLIGIAGLADAEWLVVPAGVLLGAALMLWVWQPKRLLPIWYREWFKPEKWAYVPTSDYFQSSSRQNVRALSAEALLWGRGELADPLPAPVLVLGMVVEHRVGHLFLYRDRLHFVQARWLNSAFGEDYVLSIPLEDIRRVEGRFSGWPLREQVGPALPGSFRLYPLLVTSKERDYQFATRRARRFLSSIEDLVDRSRDEDKRLPLGD